MTANIGGKHSSRKLHLTICNRHLNVGYLVVCLVKYSMIRTEYLQTLQHTHTHIHIYTLTVYGIKPHFH